MNAVFLHSSDIKICPVNFALVQTNVILVFGNLPLLYLLFSLHFV